MKTTIIPCLIILLSNILSAQVGIGNTNPQAVLDISSSNQLTPSNTDGILIPRADNFPATNPGGSQDGMLIYITGNGTPTKGFYFWNNTTTNWLLVGGRLDYVDEGNGFGWRLKDVNSTNYGSIGNAAIDLSSQIIYTGRGARGNYSLATGFHTSAEGNSASAFGDASHAQGVASTAFGRNTMALGDFSAAFGYHSQANANHSFAFGHTNIASGINSLAFGRQTIASGNYSTTFGLDNLASQTCSVAFGRLTISSGEYSSAFGYDTEASGEYSAAFGRQNIASGVTSTAFGRNTLASGNSSTTIGYGTLAQSFGEISIGLHNTEVTGNTSNFISTDRLLVLGNGWHSSSRSDALVVLKNGTITAPSFDMSEITDNKALITKEYADATYVGGAVEAPILAALYPNWTAYDTSIYKAPAYYKHKDRVYLEGLLRKSIAYVGGETIFYLPVGYRPSARVLVHGKQSNNVVRLDIMTDGRVTYQTGGIANFISLEGISFRAN